MKCHCGTELERGWQYCPRCGSRPRQLNVGSIISRMMKEMKDMNTGGEKDFDVLDLSPFFRKPRKPRGSGFSIRIVSGTGMEPRVQVRTFGNIDGKNLQKQIEDMGYKPRIKGKAETPKPHIRKKEPHSPVPKTTEEPAADIRRVNDHVVVNVTLPGVSDMADVEIREMESSVEVKAIAGEKAYFKILTKPPEFSLTEKRFEQGKLHLEFR